MFLHCALYPKKCEVFFQNLGQVRFAQQKELIKQIIRSCIISTKFKPKSQFLLVLQQEWRASLQGRISLEEIMYTTIPLDMIQ